MNNQAPRVPLNPTNASLRRTLTERVHGILATKNLTLYGLAVLSRLRHPRASSYHLPHNFYFQLASGKWTPTLHQLAVLAELSTYRLADWLQVFGFRLDDIARVQAALPRPRTALLDGTVYDPQRAIPWFRDRLRHDAIPPIVPLGQILERTENLPISLLPFSVESGRLHYAKIGRQDDFAFPDLAPGSIVRANSQLAARYLRQAKRGDARHVFLVEHPRGVCCCRLHFGTGNRITLMPTQLPFANVELELGTQARILGVVDFEIRPLLHARNSASSICSLPEIAPDLARLWTPSHLKKTVPAALPSHVLHNARLRSGLSLRTASAISRDIAEALGDEGYFTSQGSLSDYEARDNPPRHIHKLFSLCILYALPFPELLESYGIDLAKGAKPIPREWLAEADGPEASDPEAPSSLPGFLSDQLKWLGEVPSFLYGSFASLAGLPDPSLLDIYWTGGLAKPMHPALAGAVLAIVNRRKTTPPAFLRKSVWDQPLYVLLRRDGSYLLANCTLENDMLVIHPHADGFIPHERLRNRVDAEVLGQIMTVVRSLIPST